MQVIKHDATSVWSSASVLDVCSVCELFFIFLIKAEGLSIHNQPRLMKDSLRQTLLKIIGINLSDD